MEGKILRKMEKNTLSQKDQGRELETLFFFQQKNLKQQGKRDIRERRE